MKFYNFLFTLFFLFFGNVFSQENSKFYKSFEIAEKSLENSQIDTSLKASKEALTEAFLINNHALKAKSYNIIGLCFAKLSETKKAISFFEKGINEAILTENDTIKGDLYCNLASAYQNLNPTKEANYSKKGYFFIRKISNSDSDARDLLSQKTTFFSNKVILKSAIDLKNFQNQIDFIESGKSKIVVEKQDTKTVDLLLAVIIGILLLLVFSLLRNNMQRDKSNKILEKRNAELIIAKEKAEKATQLKSQFISSITHELRTPLYGVVGITDIIIDDHKELASSPHINSLRFSANYLLSLVNDLLQINKIEERKVVLENNLLNLEDELTAIANSLEFIALKNSNSLTINVDKAIPTKIVGDKLKLSQIFINLISNALKFTKKGQVTINATLQKQEDKNYFITFEVKDTGIGIPKAAQEEIFEKFVQLERNEDDYQGTGLGLSIVKKLVEIFGGEIILESQLGKGTSFSFTIPFEEPETTKIVTSEKTISISENTNFHILVVEDNKINQIVTRKILEKNNFKCTVTEDGYKSIEILTTEKIDLILMDINMPIINGYETSKLIRKNKFKTPIIALTAFDKEEISEKAFEAGMNDVIIKPFDNEQLFKIISDNLLNLP